MWASNKQLSDPPLMFNTLCLQQDMSKNIMLFVFIAEQKIRMQIKVHGDHVTLLKDQISFPEGHITFEVFRPAVRPKLTLRFGSEAEWDDI